MPIPILGIPGGNHMIYMRVRSAKELQYSVKIIQDFWKKPDGVERRPNLVRQCPDPESDQEDADFLTRFIQDHDSSWAAAWGITQDVKDLPIINVRFELEDNDVMEKLLEILRSWFSITEEKTSQIFTQKAVVIFMGEPQGEISKVVDEINLETLISLANKNEELPKNIRSACADRAWKALEGKHSALSEVRNKQREVLESNENLMKEIESKDNQIDKLTKALDDDEKQIVELSLKELMKELEARGYIEPKRRPCTLCQDTKEHKTYVGDLSEMNEKKNVEGLCPLVEKGQRCLQCTKMPPECFSNESLLICEAAVEVPCNKTIEDLNHSTIVGKRRHTQDIHKLDKLSDGPLVKKIKRKYGTWIVPEYESEDEKLEW